MSLFQGTNSFVQYDVDCCKFADSFSHSMLHRNTPFVIALIIAGQEKIISMTHSSLLLLYNLAAGHYIPFAISYDLVNALLMLLTLTI